MKWLLGTGPKFREFFYEVDIRWGKTAPEQLFAVSQTRGVVPKKSIGSASDGAQSFAKYKVAERGDLVLNRFNAYRGALGITPSQGLVSPDYTVLRPKRACDSSYFNYWLRCDEISNAMKATMGGLGASDPDSSGFSRISIGDLMNLRVHVESVDERINLAGYLDKETSKIDLLISKKELLLEKLLERRQALITQVTTRGLDPNSPMKDSEVPWLEKVPKSWVVRPHWAVMRESKAPVGNLHTRLDLLSLTKQGVILRDLEGGGKFPANFENYQQVKAGDLILCLFDVEETPRTVGLAATSGMITSAYTVMKITNVNPSFLEWYLIGADNEKRFKAFYSGLRNTISKDIFGSIRFALPPPKEQEAIVTYLDRETSQIDTLTNKAKKAIELLKERRQALITQVVTGKIDVRGLAGGNS